MSDDRIQPNEEQEQGSYEQALSADHVAQLAVYRHGDGAGQHVSRGDPQQVAHVVQVSGNGGKRR